MNNYLKEINPKAQSLVKVKQSQHNIENYLDIISLQIYNNTFNNAQLVNALKEWLTIFAVWCQTDLITSESCNAIPQNKFPDLIDPIYVARMVLFLASDDALMCTANNYMVEAGSI